MKTKTENRNPARRGSALILVIVVTVLLAVIGVMFVMVTRLDGVLSASIIQDRRLDEAVRQTTARIEQILMEDLFGSDDPNAMPADGRGLSNEPWDAPGPDDPWLADLEPVWRGSEGTPNPADDLYRWNHITNLAGLSGYQWNRNLRNGEAYTPQAYGGIVPEYPEFKKIVNGQKVLLTKQEIIGRPADADGDGVADSVWIALDDTVTGGQTVYAAVRIIDNCAMLNLNTAFPFFQSPAKPVSAAFTRAWYLNHESTISGPYDHQGRYLSEINYIPFLRGRDRDTLPDDSQAIGWYPNWYNLLLTRSNSRRVFFREHDGYYNLFVQSMEAMSPERLTPEFFHDYLMLYIDKPGSDLFRFFGIQDELEIRNRFLLTSPACASFEGENAAYYTFDCGRGQYGAGGYAHIRSKRIPYDSRDFGAWKERINPDYFDPPSPSSDYSNQYDRRHICTFYSFDRNLPWARRLPPLSGLDPQLYRDLFMPEGNRPVNLREQWVMNGGSGRRLARGNLLRLMYALRDYYYAYVDPSWRDAARFSAQVAANLIDYLDVNNAARTGPFGDASFDPLKTDPEGQVNRDVTYINRDMVRRMIQEVDSEVDIDEPKYAGSAFDFHLDPDEVIYGIERQPFIAEILSYRESGDGVLMFFAVELVNPYDSEISLDDWKLTGLNMDYTLPAGLNVPAGDPASDVLGRLVLYYTGGPAYSDLVDTSSMYVRLHQIGHVPQALATVLRLQRPLYTGATTYLTVDLVSESQLYDLFQNTGVYSLRRSDKGWAFANMNSAGPAIPLGDAPPISPRPLGLRNTGSAAAGVAIPVADSGDTIYTVGDFQKLLWTGSRDTTGRDPNCLTYAIGIAGSESNLRYDPNTSPELMGFLCTLNRFNGSLPGRININTAPKHVIAAAVPPGLTSPLDLADEIIRKRPFRSVSELIRLDWMNDSHVTLSPPGPFAGRLERDNWILNRLSNIFTVRSDVFTAYLLVRVGPDGPQRRMIAIFDRSQVWTPEDRPRLVTLHPVPDPR